MTQTDLGANRFTFTGDRTNIVYNTQRPGPIILGEDFSGGELEYQGIEGNRTFFGKDLTLQSSPLGTLLTATLKANDDTGGITLTLLIPPVVLNASNALNFATVAIKTSSRGFTASAGPGLMYTILPLLATASRVIMPE
jgi:hypothetical protein